MRAGTLSRSPARPKNRRSRASGQAVSADAAGTCCASESVYVSAALHPSPPETARHSCPARPARAQAADAACLQASRSDAPRHSQRWSTGRVIGAALANAKRRLTRKSESIRSANTTHRRRRPSIPQTTAECCPSPPPHSRRGDKQHPPQINTQQCGRRLQGVNRNNLNFFLIIDQSYFLVLLYGYR